MEKRILIAFNKRGDKMGKSMIPESFYLITEKDWVLNALDKTPALDGIAFILYSTGKINIVRYAN